MNERTVTVGALAVGLVAFGGLFLLSQRRNSLAPKVIGVRILSATERAPAYVEIGIEPSSALLRFAKEGETWEYRVAEPAGRIYLRAPTSDEHTVKLRVPYAYSQPPSRPQVEVWIENARQASTIVESMPPPVFSPLQTQPGAAIRAFHVSAVEAKTLVAGDPEQRSGIHFAPSRPIQPKERWLITVLQTPLQTRTGANAEYATYVPRLNYSPLPIKPRSAIARLYYAEDVTALRVRVRRILHRTRSERITIPGLRLSKVEGQTALVWSDLVVRKLREFGLQISPKSIGFVGGGHPLASGLRTDPGDLREPSMSLNLISSDGARNFPGEDPWTDDATLMSLEGSDLDRLNVRSLTIGNATWRSKHEFRGPINPRPFNIVLTVTKQWDEALGTFEATIPVEPAAADSDASE